MNKRLVLVRHAKSDWDDHSLSDHDRPLNDRGMSNAPMMGRFLASMIAKPDVFLSSSANRALTTARFFAEQFQYPEIDIKVKKSLHLCSFQEAFKQICNINDKYQSAILFGHNPFITELAEYLSATYIGNMPTCSVVCLDFKCSTWSEISKDSAKIIHFEYPKKSLE